MSSSADNFRRFAWAGSNSFFVRCDKDQLVFGSSEGNYAIWIEGSLLRGTSKPTQTFNNPTLTKKKDFQVRNHDKIMMFGGVNVICLDRDSGNLDVFWVKSFFTTDSFFLSFHQTIIICQKKVAIRLCGA